MDQRTIRQLALAIAVAWFAYWGHLAYRSHQAKEAAEQASFLADRRQDWAASEAHFEERRTAASELVRAMSLGFLLPLGLLVLVEAARAIHRRPPDRS